MQRLEREIDEAQREEFRQRFDTVRVTQLMLTMLPLDQAAAIQASLLQPASLPAATLPDGTPITGPAGGGITAGGGGGGAGGSSLEPLRPSRVSSRTPSRPASPGRSTISTRSDGVGPLRNNLESLLSLTSRSGAAGEPRAPWQSHIGLLRDGLARPEKRARGADASALLLPSAAAAAGVGAAGLGGGGGGPVGGGASCGASSSLPPLSLSRQRSLERSGTPADAQGWGGQPGAPKRAELEHAVNTYFSSLATVADHALDALPPLRASGPPAAQPE